MLLRAFVVFASFAACVGSDPASPTAGEDGGTNVTPPADASPATDAAVANDAGDADAAPPCSMISWWTGDDTLADKLGANNLVSPDGGAFLPGKYNAALAMDGTKSYERASPIGVDALAQLTIEGWVKLALCASDTRRLIDHKTPNANEGFYLDFLSEGTLRVRVGELQVSAAGFANDVVLHVAATYDGQTLIVYANGVEAGRVKGAAPAAVPSADAGLKIGASANGSFSYCGLADELALYGRALSAEEVLAIYANGPTQRCKN